MKQQKLVQVRLAHLDCNECVELSIQKYLDEGWRIVSYLLSPATKYDEGDVVVFLEKEQ